MDIEQTAKNYAKFFESISQETPMQDYAQVFDENIYFEDPFQKVIGLAKVYHIFQHMYETLYRPHFIVDEIVFNKNSTYLHWNFTYQLKPTGEIQKFTGVSRVQFLETGKALSHVDYWDAAENVYEKVPLLGSILRRIKQRIKA